MIYIGIKQGGDGRAIPCLNIRRKSGLAIQGVFIIAAGSGIFDRNREGTELHQRIAQGFGYFSMNRKNQFTVRHGPALSRKTIPSLGWQLVLPVDARGNEC